MCESFQIYSWIQDFVINGMKMLKKESQHQNAELGR